MNGFTGTIFTGQPPRIRGGCPVFVRRAAEERFPPDKPTPAMAESSDMAFFVRNTCFSG
jgi:hypothetical protein